jgi:two-component system sensor histidine kinase KdpD
LQNEERNYLNSINALVSRLIKVAEISLLLTELRTVDDKISIRKTPLTEIVQNAIPEEDVKKKNLDIQTQDLDGSQYVLAEPRLLSSCISIILDNSIKYSPVNSTITLSCRNNDTFYTLDISDNGPGFSSTALSTLFELFTADNLDHKSHGFGIGLATAKRIMDLLGGKINIRNKESGASVLLHLKKQ